MKLIYIEEQHKEAEFAKRAAGYFAAHDTSYSYTDEDVKPGEMMAIRWNGRTVLVIRLDECHDPSLYDTGQLIAGDLPPLKGEFDVNGTDKRDKRITELEMAVRAALVALANGGPWAPGNAETCLKKAVS